MPQLRSAIAPSAQEWLDALALPDSQTNQVAMALVKHARSNEGLDTTLDEDCDTILALAGIAELDTCAKETLRASMENLKVVSPNRKFTKKKVYLSMPESWKML